MSGVPVWQVLGYVEGALQEIETITLRPMPTKAEKGKAINEIRDIARAALEKVKAAQ